MVFITQKKSSRDLYRYAGKWVALAGWAVVDSAKSLPELMEKVKQKKTEAKVSVMLVPRKDEGPYILFFDR